MQRFAFASHAFHTNLRERFLEERESVVPWSTLSTLL